MRVCRSLRAASEVPFIILARACRRGGPHTRARDGRGRLPRKAREFPRIAGAHAQYPAARERRRATMSATRAQAVSLRRMAARQRGPRAREPARRARALAQLRVPRARVAARAWKPRGLAPQAHRTRARPRCRSFRSQHRRAHQPAAPGSRRRCARARASSRQFTVKVMSSVFPLNAHELCVARRCTRAGTFLARAAPMRRTASETFNNSSDDPECMARLAAGDTHALRELYQRHGRALLRFSSRDVPLAPGGRRHGARHLRRADA